MTTRSSHIHLPQGLDLWEHFPWHRREWQECCAYLVGLVYRNSHYGDHALDGDFVPLKTERLRKVIPQRQLEPVRKALVDKHILEIDRQYLVGERSMGYRLLPAFRFQLPTKYDFHAAGEVFHKLRKLRQEEWDGLGEIHQQLRAMFRHVDFNVPEMIGIIRKHGDSMSERDRKYLPALYLAAEELGSDDWMPTVCEFGRFHGPLTRLKKECRAGIRINGSRVVSIDIANSQPVFLCVALQDNEDEEAEAHVITTTTTTLLHAPATQIAIPIRCAVFAKTAADYQFGSRKIDVECFLRLVEGGELYQSLLPRVPRDDAKKQLFRDVFYGPLARWGDLTETFAREFPTVYRFIRDQKRGNYRKLAWAMQRAESNFMLNKVCPRIISEYPGVPFLTIHDSILCEPRYADEFKRVMLDEFASIGIAPTIRRESY